MRENIYTIPVKDVFDIKNGCPLCRMRDTIENRILDYIMGPAMMEPDIRGQTNQQGFCPTHFKMMVGRRGRLSLALILESHLDEIINSMEGKKGLLAPSASKQAEHMGKIIDGCFVCQKIEWGFGRMIDTIYMLYETQADFRDLFNGQPGFCLPHYQMLLAGCSKKVMKQKYKDFQDNLTRITDEYLKQLKSDVKHFTSMYDYRNNTEGADWGNSRDSIERAIEFLTSRRPD